MSDNAIATLALPISKQPPERIAGLCAALRAIECVPGDVVECGVWKGASIIVARMIAPKRRCWLFDTFSGMTKPTEVDVSRKGGSALAKFASKAGEPWMGVSVSQVVDVLKSAGVYDHSKIMFVEGDVAETLRDGAKLPKQIALLRLDTDWYESTKIELEVLWPRLWPGGILIVDDYGYWRGARRAVDEFFACTGMEPQFIDDSAVQFVKPQ